VAQSGQVPLHGRHPVRPEGREGSRAYHHSGREGPYPLLAGPFAS